MRTLKPLIHVWLLPLAIAGNAFAATDKPNVIILLGDDVGYEAFGCTGNTYAKTPHIDKLASEGLVFDRFYGTVSQCAPIRAELYTGLFPRNSGVLANGMKKNKPGIKSMVDHLEPLGYRVGLTGKLGFSKGAKFEKIKGFPESCNSSVEAYSLDGLKEFVESARQTNQPFCAVVASIHAHHPWDLGAPPEGEVPVPEHYVDTPITRDCLKVHAAEVALFDKQLADVRSMMGEMELTDNTIVIVLSEQGIAMPRAKWSVYEKGNRSLCIACWPGKIAPGRTDALGQYCDILPTIVDYAGGKATGLDGLSLRPVLEGKSQRHRDYVHLVNVNPTRQWALIQDDWKLVWTPPGAGNQRCLHQNFKKVGKKFASAWSEWERAAESDSSAQKKLTHVLSPEEFELYRIDQDYNERNNLAKNAENKQVVETMHELLLDELGDVTANYGVGMSKKDKKGRKGKGKRGGDL